MRYTVVRDTREKADFWEFAETSNCAGTMLQKLHTGDYSLSGLEEYLTIERKANTGEFARNITEKRFDRELKRMEEYPHPFMILEFSMADILSFPANSTIPPFLWPKVRITKWFILKKLIDYQMNYKTKIILAGTHGKEVAASIFKRMVELYGKDETFPGAAAP